MPRSTSGSAATKATTELPLLAFAHTVIDELVLRSQRSKDQITFLERRRSISRPGATTSDLLDR